MIGGPPTREELTRTYNRLVDGPVSREDVSRRLVQLRRKDSTAQYEVSPYIVSDEFRPRTIRVGGIYDLLWRMGKLFRDLSSPSGQTFDHAYIYKV